MDPAWRGVGATDEQRARTVYRMDEPQTREILEAGAAVWASAPKPILFVEWQRWPTIWDQERRAVDPDYRTPSQFHMTGSALPLVAGTNGPHKGAGRTVSVRMRPLYIAGRGIAEPTVSLGALLRGERPPISGQTTVSVADYTREMLCTGVPAIRALEGRAQRVKLDAYLERVENRNFREEGHAVRRPATLRCWMAAYAAATAQITSYDKTRGGAA